MLSEGNVFVQVTCPDAVALSRQLLVLGALLGRMSLLWMTIGMMPLFFSDPVVKVFVSEFSGMLFVHHLDTCRDLGLPLGNPGPVGFGIY